MITPALALIGDIGGPELLLILVLVLLLFGGKALPDFAKGIGRAMREFKKATSGVEEEIKRAMDDTTSVVRQPVSSRPHALPPAPPVPSPAVATSSPLPNSTEAGAPKASPPTTPAN